MPAVRVFEYEFFDHATKRWIRGDRRGTESAIYKSGGVPIRSTEAEADSSELSKDGFVEREPR